MVKVGAILLWSRSIREKEQQYPRKRREKIPQVHARNKRVAFVYGRACIVSVYSAHTPFQAETQRLHDTAATWPASRTNQSDRERKGDNRSMSMEWCASAYKYAMRRNIKTIEFDECERSPCVAHLHIHLSRFNFCHMKLSSVVFSNLILF